MEPGRCSWISDERIDHGSIIPLMRQTALVGWNGWPM